MNLNTGYSSSRIFDVRNDSLSLQFDTPTPHPAVAAPGVRRDVDGDPHDHRRRGVFLAGVGIRVGDLSDFGLPAAVRGRGIHQGSARRTDRGYMFSGSHVPAV